MRFRLVCRSDQRDYKIAKALMLKKFGLW